MRTDEKLCNMTAKIGDKEFKAEFLDGNLVVFHEGKRYEIGKLLKALGFQITSIKSLERTQNIITQLNKGLNKYKRKFNDVNNKYIGIKSFLNDYWTNTNAFKDIEKYGRAYKEKFLKYHYLEEKEKVLQQKEERLNKREQELNSLNPVIVCGNKITEKELLDILKQLAKENK